MRALLLACVGLVACERDGSPTTDTDTDTDTTPAHTTPPDPTADTGATGSPTPTGTTAAPTADTARPAGTGDSAPVVEPTADTGPFAWLPDPVADVIVDCGGSGDFTTIQAAIDASVSGTHIGVRTCRYVERIDFRGKSLDVFGIDGSDATLLDGDGVGPVVRVTRGESDGTRLAGFTVIGGRGDGAAVLVKDSVLVMEDVVLAANGAGSGTALSAQSSRLVWIGGGTTGNDVGRTSEPVWANAGVFVVQDVLFTCDRARAAADTHNVALVHDSTVTCDGAYGWYVERGEILVRRSSFTGSGTAALWAEDRDDNRSENAVMANSSFVGGDFGASFRYMDVDAENCVFLGRSVGLDLPADRPDSHVEGSILVGATCGLRGDPVESYDVDWNLFAAAPACNAGGTNTVTGDPMFVAAPLDLHLAPGSPAIDAGDPDPDRDDVDGTRNDLGRYGGPEGAGPP